jgi:hypothetical protein
MHHTCAYGASIADATLTDVAAISDVILAINNGHFFPTRDYWLAYAFAAGASVINRARIVSPTMRQVTTPWIRPLNTGLTVASPLFIADYRDNPFRIRASEELEVDIMQTTGAAAQVMAILGLQTTPTPPPIGDIYTLRGTSSTAAVVRSWTPITVTWQDILPQGKYTIVGGRAISTNGIASRLSLENQVERPGSISLSTAAGISHPAFERGGLGAWGNFTNQRMPIVEVMCQVADASHEYYLDFIRIA